MENLIIRRGDAFGRVAVFIEDHPIVPELPALTTLATNLDTIITVLGDSAEDQDIGRGDFRGGTAYRRLVANQLRAQMRSINKIAKALKPELFPGVREQFRMPDSNSYPKLISRAEAFIDAIGPIKSTFTDRGMAATFDTELTAKKVEFVTATGRKNSGHATQMQGTANLLAKSREGVDILHELDAILSHQYRNDPGLLAAWKGACRIERDPVTESAVETPPVGGGAGI